MSVEPISAQAESKPSLRRAPSAGLPALRTVRRAELRRIVPLADTTIYELEQRGDFPQRFNLTPRCVVWDLDEVEAWLADRRRASRNAEIAKPPAPDVRQRKTRPVRR